MDFVGLLKENCVELGGIFVRFTGIFIIGIFCYRLRVMGLFFLRRAYENLFLKEKEP